MAKARTGKGPNTEKPGADRPASDPQGDQETYLEEDAGPVIAGLPAGSETPDSLTEVVQPAAGDGEEEPTEGLRISTILGPLPARVSVQKTRDLNDAVHQILVIGLAVSTVLLLAGLALQLITLGALPSHTLSPGEALRGALTLQPAGLLSLGLLALLLTPIVRVIGSVIVFVWERDRLYTVVTLVVLTVMTVSVLAGGG